MNTPHKILSLALSSILFVSAGVGLAGGQKRAGKTATRKPSSQQRVRATGRQASAKWYTFTGPDGDFTVALPGKPVREPDVYVLGRTVRGYSLVKDFVHFQILLQDTGLEPNNREGDKLPMAFPESMVKDIEGRRGTIIRAELLRINVHELEAWVPFKNHPGQNLHFISRFIARNGQLYNLTCTSLIPDQKLDARGYHRFFESFQVIGPPRPR